MLWVWCKRKFTKLSGNLFYLSSVVGEKSKKKCSAHLVKRSLSFTHDTLFTLCTLFPFVPALCTWKGLNLPAVGFWIGGRGRLRRCHRAGRAPLLSECVMQQPLLWMPEEKTFGVDVWKCFLRFVLSVGGRLRRRWLVTFPLRNIWQVSVEQHQCEHYIKVLFFFSLSATESLKLCCWWCPADCAC